ncbi:hypothetical protein DSO57_1005283 [Entomophthora muscae]|uniref:Uncharacterized protein n=1 Tax=Entomophthora muscae TaxID=34485 RepID=A0ACC2TIW3_9FUNG|nr:hypothetical protein DSO57_1005283 [Entomophthora muscae]
MLILPLTKQGLEHIKDITTQLFMFLDFFKTPQILTSMIKEMCILHFSKENDISLTSFSQFTEEQSCVAFWGIEQIFFIIKMMDSLHSKKARMVLVSELPPPVDLGPILYFYNLAYFKGSIADAIDLITKTPKPPRNNTYLAPHFMGSKDTSLSAQESIVRYKTPFSSNRAVIYLGLFPINRQGYYFMTYLRWYHLVDSALSRLRVYAAAAASYYRLELVDEGLVIKVFGTEQSVSQILSDIVSELQTLCSTYLSNYKEMGGYMSSELIPSDIARFVMKSMLDHSRQAYEKQIDFDTPTETVTKMRDYFHQPFYYRAMIVGRSPANISIVVPGAVKLFPALFTPLPLSTTPESRNPTYLQLGHPNSQNSGLEYFLTLAVCPDIHLRVALEILASFLSSYLYEEIFKYGCRIHNVDSFIHQAKGQYGILISLDGTESSETLENFIEATLEGFQKRYGEIPLKKISEEYNYVMDKYHNVKKLSIEWVAEDLWTGSNSVCVNPILLMNPRIVASSKSTNSSNLRYLPNFDVIQKDVTSLINGAFSTALESNRKVSIHFPVGQSPIKNIWEEDDVGDQC